MRHYYRRGQFQGQCCRCCEKRVRLDSRKFCSRASDCRCEKSGVGAAVADLFVAHKVILCPLVHNRPEAIAKVSAMWEVAGAQVETLGVEQHDQVLAATSHLPHVLAYSLVNTLAETEYVEEIFQFAAGGFRDFSRIASSDPVMWRDICLENRDAILSALNQYQANLDGLKHLIEQSNGDQAV